MRTTFDSRPYRRGSYRGLGTVAAAAITLVAALPATPAQADADDKALAYIANYSDGTLSVVDTTNGTVTGTITVGAGPRSVAAAPDGTRLYVTNSKDNTVSVVDTGTATVTATVPVGKDPQGVEVSPTEPTRTP